MKRKTVSLAVSMALVGSATGPGTAQAATEWSWSQTPAVTVFEPTDGSIAGVPMVSAVPVAGNEQKAVLYAWVRNDDVGSAGPTTGLKRSTDGGQTFSPGFTQTDSSFATAARVRDGSIVDVAFIPESIANSTTVNMRVKRSTDDGVTWIRVPSTFATNSGFTWGGMNRGLRVNPGMIQDGAGNLYISYYTRYTGDVGTRTEVAISRDLGRTWQRHGPIITASNGQQYDEAGIAWAPTGEMVAVVTQDEIVSAGSPRKHIKLITARSTNGAQWTGHKVLPLSFSPGYQFRPDAAGTVRYGINPSLNLLGNGAMTLVFGRPDNWFAISTDGGRSFTQARRTYVNYPQSGNPYHGSSGNGNHAVIDTDTVIVSGDNCAPTWGCPAADNGWTIDDRYRVWRKFITVNRPSTGTKLDLRGMADTGRLSVDTNLTATNPRAPETGVRGAFDGDITPASSAIRPAGAGGASTYTLKLDHAYNLTELGLSLHPGLLASATVESSVDGQHWTPIPFAGGAFDNIRSLSLDYRRVAGNGVTASQVRFTVDDPNGPALLNELEVFVA